MIALDTLARYYFVPAVREGLASYLAKDADGPRALIEGRLIPRVDDEDRPLTDVIPMRVGLFGPGDVVGFDRLAVTRTDPRPNVWDHEPNFMPLVELSEPDLPWRLTPGAASADGSGRLTPWITLIALRQGEYAGLDERVPEDLASNSLPIRWIRGVSTAALPKFDTLWQWAHVQVTDSTDLGSASDPDGLGAAVARRIGADPESHDSHIVARLICPRLLQPRTAYTAFVVPTFKLGQVAAGLATLAPGEGGMTPGWGTEGSTPLNLPYYYRFDFATSDNVDFEYLVRLLEPRPMEGLGKRRMDCSKMAYDLPDCPGRSAEDPHVLEIEGALMSPQAVPGTWHNETTPIATFRTELADLLNMAARRAEPGGTDTDAADPVVVPPIFGRRHAQQFRVDAGTDGRWLNDVNLDPRQRAAAGFGALVIEKDQEALMASVWEQLGSIEDANQVLVHGQLGLEASKGVFRRLNTLGLPDFLWTCAPVFDRVRGTGNATVTNNLSQSPIPPAAFDPAFRRVIRRGSGIRKRQQRADQPSPPGRDLLSRLNQREVAAAGAHPKVPGIPSMCDITDRAVEMLERETEAERKATGRFRVTGRVVDRHSRDPVRRARVQVWDKDLFLNDLLGDAVTNDRGWFRVELDSSYYKEWSFLQGSSLDNLPDVFFKVSRGGRSLGVISPRILRGLQPGDTTVVVEVDQGAGADISLGYRLVGQVIDRATRKGIPWLRVEAWDKDILAADLVGGAITDAEGAFTIAFGASHSREWFIKKRWHLDRRPDVYFKVFRGPELITDTSDRPYGSIARGDTAIIVEIQAPARLPVEPDSRAADFCEPAITCDALRHAVESDPALAPLRDVAEAICSGVRGWLDLRRPDDPRPVADLVAVRNTVEAAIAPTVTIPARVMKRLRLRPGVHQRSVLSRLESEVDFPQPMYEPLAEISQDLILPGVETVPQNTMAILRTNRRFIEAYMLGLNDSLTSEMIWRGAPVYVWTTCMRQFWDVRGLVEQGVGPDTTKDISRIASWPRNSELGVHDPRATGSLTPDSEPMDRAVLLIRGDVLKRYPNTVVYAIEAGANGKPMLAEFQDGEESERVFPIFSGSLPPDLTFLGFDLTPAQMCNYFIVFEERLGQPRFGFDRPEEGAELENLSGSTWWYDMNWSHLGAEPGDYIDDRTFGQASTLQPTWGASSAVMANVALQRPVRMCVAARRMLPMSICEPTA